MPDPNLHWDGQQWLRWDGSDWVPDPSIAGPHEESSGGRTGLIAVLVIALVAVLAVGAGVVWMLRQPVSDTAAPAGNEVMRVPLGGAQDAFTEPVGTDLTITPKLTSQPEMVSGGQAGLYGGTVNEGSCGKTRLISFLLANPDKARAWAGVLGIQPEEIRTYVNGLTPMLLRRDTYVINHGYTAGRATAFPSVLQAGTAMLVGKHGLPVVRCFCGNPLTQPTAMTQDVTFTGPTWPEWNPQSITVVSRQVSTVNVFILVDVRTGERFARPPGTSGDSDTVVGRTPEPATPEPAPPMPSRTATPRDYPTQSPQDTPEPTWDYCEEYPEECYPEDYPPDYDSPTAYPDEYPTDAVG